jgi:hypoxanthine phosphoribosyltransferase
MGSQDRISVPENGLTLPGHEEPVPAALGDRITRVLIPEPSIEARVRVLARQIGQAYRKAERVTALIVLDGAVVFAADLGRQVHRLGGPEIDYDFIKTATYGDEIKREGETSREVKVLVEPRRLTGKHVLIVEDIVDQGFTLAKIQQLVLEHDPASLQICALLFKRLEKPTEAVRRLRDDLIVSYVGFDVPDCWVAGYGIDVSGDFRELPFIVGVNETYYLNR